MTTITCRVLVVAALGLLGCSADAGPPTVGPDATMSDADARPSSDASPPGCDVALFVQPSPPRVGDVVTVTAMVDGAPGGLEWTWTVWDVHQVEIEASRGLDGRSVEFPVPVAGDYKVELALGDASGCGTTIRTFSVAAPGATSARWWVQVVFPDRSGLPPHEESLVVPTDMPVAIIVPEPQLVDLAVVAADGAPVAATVRWLRVPTSSQPHAVAVEAATNAEGRVQARLRDDAVYQVLVVPRCADGAPCAVTPTGYRTWSVADREDLVVVAGQEIAGTVTGPDGGPLAGARVALTVDGVPTTVATTTTAGTFAVRTSRLGRARVVVAPDGGGLPRLEATLPDLVAGQPLAVRYAPLATRALTGAAIRLDGEAYAGARLTVVADIAVAGTIAQSATTVDAPGHFVSSQFTGVDRRLLPLRAPAVPASIVLEPVLFRPTVVAVDLSATAPVAFDALPPAPLGGRVWAPDGTTVAGATVRAVPTGVLAEATGMVPGVVSGASGGFSLAVARGGSYQLVAADPTERFAEVRRDVASDDGAALDLVMTAAVHVDGTVTARGAADGALAGASVALRCLQCTGTEASRLVSPALVTRAGRFRIVAPDPAAAPP